MRSGQEIAGRTERQAGRDALGPENIHHPASRDVICPYTTIEGTGQNPPARRREAGIEDSSLEAAQFADDPDGLDVDQAEGEVVTDT